MVTMTVYVNSDTFCCILNTLNHHILFDGQERKDVSLKKTKDYPYEVQVPIQIIGQFVKKDHTTINLRTLVELNQTNVEKVQ